MSNPTIQVMQPTMKNVCFLSGLQNNVCIECLEKTRKRLPEVYQSNKKNYSSLKDVHKIFFKADSSHPIKKGLSTKRNTILDKKYYLDVKVFP